MPREQPLAADGSASVQWDAGLLHVALTAAGLAPNTATQAFLVPGTCSNPGGSPTFATYMLDTDANGSIAEARTRIGAEVTGIRLPKALEVVQNGQTMLCADTTQVGTYKDASGLVQSASISLALTPDPPGQAAPDPLVFLNKVTLGNSSIDGPALSSSVPGSISESVLAWTGTDASHHINVMTSGDGLHFAQKVTLPQTSPYRPDVALVQPRGAVAVAWTGTDASHSLNVLYDVYGTQRKLTLAESSIAAPALLIGPGFYLAWTGTDANHTLNIIPINVTSSGLSAGTKVVLRQFSSDAGPHLARRNANTVVLNWTARSSLQLNVATSQDATNFTLSRLPQTSSFAPQTESLGTVAGSRQEWIGWTGTDPDHHLNLQWTTSFPQFPDPATTKTILSQTALGGPALGYNGGELIAWTGTDSAHSLNIARYALT